MLFALLLNGVLHSPQAMNNKYEEEEGDGCGKEMFFLENLVWNWNFLEWGYIEGKGQGRIEEVTTMEFTGFGIS